MDQDSTNLLLIITGAFFIMVFPMIVDLLLFHLERDHEYPELTTPVFPNIFFGTLCFYFVSIPAVLIRKLFGIHAGPGRPGKAVSRERSKRHDADFFRDATSQFDKCRKHFFIMFIVMVSYLLFVALFLKAISKIVTTFYALLAVCILLIVGIALYRKLSVWVVKPVLEIICKNCEGSRFEPRPVKNAIWFNAPFRFLEIHPDDPFCDRCADELMDNDLNGTSG